MVICNPLEVSKVSAVLQRFLLATAVVLIAGVALPSIGTAAGTDPATFINNLGNQLRAVTSYPSPERKLARFRDLFREDFDVPGLGRFVLGRFWPIFTPSEQQEFLGLFENLVLLTYSKRLLEYADGSNGPRETGSRLDQDGAVVFSEISRGPLDHVRKNPSSSHWANAIASSIDLFCWVHWATILQIVPCANICAPRPVGAG